MTTKAQLLAAAKRIIAEAAKKSAKRKSNPAPRIGTKKPTRASQITGAKPTKRLVKRRKANKVEGYFPNPSEIKHAHETATQKRNRELPYFMQTATMQGWTNFAQFASRPEAEKYAKEYARRTGKGVRVVKE